MGSFLRSLRDSLNRSIFAGIEWLAINKISLNEEKTKNVLNFLEILEEDDDVQYVYANLELDNNSLIKREN